VDDSFLVRVLNGLADLDEQIEPLARREAGFDRRTRDLNAPDQVHHEIRPPVSVAPASRTLAIFG